jgi:hypothetical protein
MANSGAIRIGDIVDIKPSDCPHCGAKLSFGFGVSGADKKTSAPKAGTINICGVCKNLAAFEQDMTLRKLTDDETVEVMSDARFRTLMAGVAAVGKKVSEGTAAAEQQYADSLRRFKNGE